MLRYPWLANRDCNWCLIHLYDENNRHPIMGRDGQTQELRELSIESAKPFCRRKDKSCPKGNPEEPKTLSENNQNCYEHYRECRAVGKFPEEPIVLRNAAIIREIEDAVNQEHESELRIGIKTAIHLAMSR